MLWRFPSDLCLVTCDFYAMPTASREIVVSNKLGLHARPAMQFVDVANQFQSNIKVFKGGDEPCDADGKSVMQMIILAATEGTALRIEAEGDDAEAAVKALGDLFDEKFGEDE
jgi:phosphocarrier protein HPr